MKNLSKVILGLFFVATLPTTLSAQADGADVEEVVVTGSRITDPNIVSSSQIAVVDGQDIVDAGVTRVEDYLNDMPQISPGQSITNSNGASGAATVNLRNLGCGRTLVLLNGRRMPPGTTAGGNCADLNTIPTLLLDRVEVLTGGASSIYGSDAVAGVVNFILDDDFEGFKATYQYGFYNHENDNSSLRALVDSYNYEKAPSDVQTGDTNKVAIAFGGDIDGGKGHITAFFEHTDTKPILQGEYDISACALSGGVSRCGGSSTIPPGRWADFGGYASAGFVNVDPSITRVDFKVQGNEFVPRAGQTFNYNPTNFFQRPDDRVNGGFFGKYTLTDNAELYMDATFMKSESNAQIAFSGTFGNIEYLPCYNPLLSAQQYAAACSDWTGMGGDHAPDFATNAAALAYISGLEIAKGNGDIIDYRAPLVSLKRNVEGNPRQSIFMIKQYNTTIGLRGDIDDNWSYDVYYQDSTVDYSNEYRNDLSVIAINRGVDVISVAGVPTCVSAINGTDPSCIPYNLFQGGLPGDQGIQGVIDGGQALQNYVANATYIHGDGKQKIFSGYITGDTGLTIPGAPGSVSMVVGFETKELDADFRPDLPSRTGDRSGSGGATLPIAGKYDVDEYYFEFGIPVADGVSVDVGYRTAEYSTGNDTDSTKVGAYWTINDSVSLRASFQTAQRHANISELYSAVSDGLVDLDNDPCSIQQNGDPATATQAQCALTGLAPQYYNTDLNSPADQYNIKGGGNPNVAPEESESTTVGVVLTPDSVPGLSVTLDYFDITVEDGIGSISAKTALDKCIETGQSSYCGLINRRANGSLWLQGGYISQQLTNIGEESTSGFDVIFSYGLDTDWGPVSIEGVTTLLDSYDIVELPGSPAISCSGNWGGSCGKNPMPEFMGKYQATLSTDFDTDFTIGLRHLGETDDLNSNQIDFDAITYVDLRAQYTPTDNLVVTFGINNFFDEEPEYTSDAGTAPGNGNTFPGFFDAFGQYVFLNLTVKY